MNTPAIVILDDYTLNPGDLSWSPLEALGTLARFPRTSEPEIVARAQDAEIVLTNKTPLSAATLAQLPKLKYIGVLATGYNVVATDAARARGIVVTNVPEYGTMTVAQHTFALLLELTQRTGHHAETVRAGRWAQSADFCYWDTPLIELAGLTLGIIGSGRIGSAVARLGEAFGMTVRFARRAGGATELEAVIRASDVVTLHCPLTPDTREIIRAQTLAYFRRSAFLINTSRGLLINEADLAAALNSGQLAGAGLDVLSREPPAPDNPLLTATNCLITPHLAWAARAARGRLMEVAASNLRAFLAGAPVNVVT